MVSSCTAPRRRSTPAAPALRSAGRGEPRSPWAANAMRRASSDDSVVLSGMTARRYRPGNPAETPAPYVQRMSFRARLRVELPDRPGALAKVAAVIGEHGGNLI